MSRDTALLHPRDEIMRTMERIYRSRMTTTSGGNLSIREASGDIWITPAAIDKGSLTRGDIICVRADGSSDGPYRPSSELPFHQAVYAARPDLRAIVHAHPVALVAFSICGRVPDTRLFHQAFFVCGQPGFAPYALPGSPRLGEHIAAAFTDKSPSADHPSCVILQNHGVVVGGQSMSQAFQRFEALEFAAQTIIQAQQLGQVRYLSPEQLGEAQNRRVQLHHFHPPAATALEKELRSQLRLFLRRGCRQRLLISTEGSFSARLGPEAFLITPSQQDREQLEVQDFVLVDGQRCEAGKQPSRATHAHQAIYQRHPAIQAIVFAHPVHATAFSVTGRELDTRTIPESYIFLQDLQRVPCGIQHRQPSRIADYVQPSSPAAILENDGVLVTGRSVLDAFDRLEVLEATAEAVVNARLLGPVQAMGESVIDELRHAFFR